MLPLIKSNNIEHNMRCYWVEDSTWSILYFANSRNAASDNIYATAGQWKHLTLRTLGDATTQHRPYWLAQPIASHPGGHLFQSWTVQRYWHYSVRRLLWLNLLPSSTCSRQQGWLNSINLLTFRILRQKMIECKWM